MRTLLLGGLVALAGCTSPAPMQADTQTPANVASADPAHNSENSLDWAGSYAGVLPCADCAGIETVITLNVDGRFLRQVRYLGKSNELFTDEGRFTWDASGGTVSLETTGGSPQNYKVGENRLLHLDQAGRPIAGPLAENYLLLKTR